MTNDGIKKILVAGEGGQGVQVIAEILTLTAKDQNDETSYIPNFGVEQRNGVSIAFVQTSNDELSYPKFSTADIVVAMCDRSVEAIEEFAGENTVIIYDGSNIKDALLEPLRLNAPGGALRHTQGTMSPSNGGVFNIPARQIANDKLTAKVANVILLGVILSHVPELDKEIARRIMNDKFKKYTDKNPDLGRMNNEAFDLGLSLGAETSPGEFKGSSETEIACVFGNDKRQWQRFPELCKSCGVCIERCPAEALSWSKDLNQRGTPLPIVDIEKCTACLTCMHVCPDAAIHVFRKDQEAR